MSPLGPHLPCSAAPEQGRGCRGCGKWSAEAKEAWTSGCIWAEQQNSCCLHRLFTGDSLELSVADTNWECEWALLASALLGQRSCAETSTHLAGTESAWARPSWASTSATCDWPHSLQGCDGTNQGKSLLYTWLQLTRSGKISHAFGLEELMLLKWPYSL